MMNLDQIPTPETDAGGNYCDLLTSQEIAEKTLTQTAPKL